MTDDFIRHFPLIPTLLGLILLILVIKRFLRGALWPFTSRKKEKPVSPTEQAFRNLTPSIADLDLAPGCYAVVFLDMDMGSIMGGRSDRKTEVFSTFENALQAAATNDDEEEVGIFNSKKELILWRYGRERFIYPDDAAQVA